MTSTSPQTVIQWQCKNNLRENPISVNNGVLFYFFPQLFNLNCK